MENFFKQFPSTGVFIVALLIAFGAYQYKTTQALTRASIDNNTAAMNKLTCTIDAINDRVYEVEAKTMLHDKELKDHERRLEKVEK